jgi:hypothetical protein
MLAVSFLDITLLLFLKCLQCHFCYKLPVIGVLYDVSILHSISEHMCADC